MFSDSSSSPDPGFLHTFLEVLCEASREVESIRVSGDISLQVKSDRTPLTRADLAANSILKAGLTRLLPGSGWLSEESPDDRERLGMEYVWIVDPIDGTREFVENRPEYSVSVGLVKGGHVVFSGIAIPGMDRILYGNRATGLLEMVGCSGSAGKNLEPLVDRTGGGRTLRILVSRSEFKHGLYDSSLTSDFDIIPSGSIARKLAVLAAGEGDLVVSLFPKNDWDICGGTGLVEAAGGRVVRLDTGLEQIFNTADPLSYGLVAGHPSHVEYFLEYSREKKIKPERRYR